MTSTGFGGCLKDIKLTLYSPVFRTKQVIISDSMISLSNVNMDGCSPFMLPEETCKGDLVQNVYNGTDLFYVDAGLQPYSGTINLNLPTPLPDRSKGIY